MLKTYHIYNNASLPSRLKTRKVVNTNKMQMTGTSERWLSHDMFDALSLHQNRTRDKSQLVLSRNIEDERQNY